MFEESKQALLNGVTTMREQMKSPRISKYAPPFVHAVASSSRRRKQEGNTPKSVHWIVLAVLAICALLFFMFPTKFRLHRHQHQDVVLI